MISSRKNKPGRGGGAKPVQHRTRSKQQPDWDPTIHDLSGMRLSKREQAKRHAAHTSKNRVQIPAQHQDKLEQQHEAQPASQPADFWDTSRGMDLGAVVRDLQGTSTDQVVGHSNAQHHADSDHRDSARQHHNDTDGPNSTPEPEQNPAVQTDDKPQFQNASASDSESQHGSNSQRSYRQHAEPSETPAPGHNRLAQPPSNAAQHPSSSEARPAVASTSSRSQAKAKSHELQQGEAESSWAAAQASPLPHQNNADGQSSNQASQSAEGSTSLAAPSATQQQLEAKLSALTDRLVAAQQAAGSHRELQQQLQDLRQDKVALQSDVKQFTEHISSMLTTLQSQVSKLLLSDPTCVRPTQQPAVQSPESHNSPGQGNLGCAPLQWNVESHGTAPSPLARHQIFQSEVLQVTPAGAGDPTDVPPGTASRSYMHTQSASERPAAASAGMATSSDDCIFDDEVGLPSFVQIAADSAASRFPSTYPRPQQPEARMVRPAMPPHVTSQPLLDHYQSSDPGPAMLQQSLDPRPAMLQHSPEPSINSRPVQPMPASSTQSTSWGHFLRQEVPQQFPAVHPWSGPGTTPVLSTAPEQTLEQDGSQWLPANRQSGSQCMSLQRLPLQSQGLRPTQAAQQHALENHTAEQSFSRHSVATSLPDFARSFAKNVDLCALPQGRVDDENRNPGWTQLSASRQNDLASQGLKQVVVPHLRHRGVPHAPLPQSSKYQGPSALRMKPMSAGLPSSAPVANKHDSLALSVWAAAQP